MLAIWITKKLEIRHFRDCNSVFLFEAIIGTVTGIYKI